MAVAAALEVDPFAAAELFLPLELGNEVSGNDDGDCCMFTLSADPTSAPELMWIVIEVEDDEVDGAPAASNEPLSTAAAALLPAILLLLLAPELLDDVPSFCLPSPLVEVRRDDSFRELDNFALFAADPPAEDSVADMIPEWTMRPFVLLIASSAATADVVVFPFCV